MLTADIRNYIDRSVLCWLATADAQGQPNVSPKEIFTHHGSDLFLIAQIASPQSARNIRINPAVCVSFIDVFVQKGYQLKGQAQLIQVNAPAFAELAAPLLTMAGERFPFRSLIAVQIEQVKPILAPSYLLYPEETTEESLANSALQQYGVQKI